MGRGRGIISAGNYFVSSCRLELLKRLIYKPEQQIEECKLSWLKLGLL